MTIIKDVVFVSVWNRDFEVRTPAKFNTDTKEVFDIITSGVEVDDDGDELEHLEGQFIEWQHHSIDVEEQGGKYIVLIADYVIEQMINDKTQPLEVSLMLTLSTSHINEEAAQYLDSSVRAELIVYNKAEHGWFIYLNTDTIEEELPLIEKSLDSVISYAKGKGFQILCLDEDGPVVEELTVYEW